LIQKCHIKNFELIFQRQLAIPEMIGSKGANVLGGQGANAIGTSVSQILYTKLQLKNLNKYAMGNLLDCQIAKGKH
jgi:hypothetical protein